MNGFTSAHPRNLRLLAPQQGFCVVPGLSPFNCLSKNMSTASGTSKFNGAGLRSHFLAVGCTCCCGADGCTLSQGSQHPGLLCRNAHPSVSVAVEYCWHHDRQADHGARLEPARSGVIAKGSESQHPHPSTHMGTRIRNLRARAAHVGVGGDKANAAYLEAFLNDVRPENDVRVRLKMTHVR